MNRATPSLNAIIRRDIEQKIFSDEWPPGHRLPFEYELMAQYSCARMTVNRALGELVRAGLLVRRRKAGTFVAEPQLEHTVMQIQDFATDALARGKTYHYSLLSCEHGAATASEARWRGIEQGEDVLRLNCLHSYDDRPIALEHRIIVLATVPEARNRSFAEESPGSWLLQHIPWTEAEHHIRADKPSLATTQALAMKANDPCLVLERQTWRADRLVTEVVLQYPYDRYALSGRFAPGA